MTVGILAGSFPDIKQAEISRAYSICAAVMPERRRSPACCVVHVRVPYEVIHIRRGSSSFAALEWHDQRFKRAAPYHVPPT